MDSGSFCACLTNSSSKVAAIQGYLLKNKARPKEAVEEVSEWWENSGLFPAGVEEANRLTFFPPIQDRQRTRDTGEDEEGERRGLWLIVDVSSWSNAFTSTSVRRRKGKNAKRRRKSGKIKRRKSGKKKKRKNVKRK